MLKKDNWKLVKRMPEKQKPSNLSSPNLSILYSSWSKLPNKERSTYKVLLEEFNKNYVSIRNTLKPKPVVKLVQKPKDTHFSLDLREKYKAFKSSLVTTPKSIPMQRFILSVKKTIRNLPLYRKPTRSSTITTKKNHFESFIKRDEPLRDVSESEMNKIPYQEMLLIGTIPGNIFISGIQASCDLSLIMKNKIKSVIVIGNYNEIEKSVFVDGGYLLLKIEENEQGLFGFKANMNKAFRFLDTKLKQGNVLVCCFYGVSRSCGLIVAYLMKKYRIYLEKALSIVQSGRQVCNLSGHMLNELQGLEASFLFTF